MGVEAVARDARRRHLARGGRGVSMALRTDLNARQDDLAVARQLFYMTSSAIAAAVSSMVDRKSTRLNSSHMSESRMPSSA